MNGKRAVSWLDVYGALYPKYGLDLSSVFAMQFCF